MIAIMDSHCAVSLLWKEWKNGDLWEPIEWNFCGKIWSHHIDITSIAFGESLDENEQMKLRLFSTGRDQLCIEYDVYNSTDQGL